MSPLLRDVWCGLGPTRRFAVSYPLRPEAIESALLLYRATADPIWLSFGRDAVTTFGTLNRPPPPREPLPPIQHGAHTPELCRGPSGSGGSAHRISLTVTLTGVPCGFATVRHVSM